MHIINWSVFFASALVGCDEKLDRGPPFQFAHVKCGPPMRKVGRAHVLRYAAILKMESNGDASVSAEIDLVDAVFLYLTEGKYSEGCSITRKRSYHS